MRTRRWSRRCWALRPHRSLHPCLGVGRSTPTLEAERSHSYGEGPPSAEELEGSLLEFKGVFKAEIGQDVAEAPSAEGVEDRHSEVKALFEAKVGQDVDGAPAAEELEESHSGQGLVRGGVRPGG